LGGSVHAQSAAHFLLSASTPSGCQCLILQFERIDGHLPQDLFATSAYACFAATTAIETQMTQNHLLAPIEKRLWVRNPLANTFGWVATISPKTGQYHSQKL